MDHQNENRHQVPVSETEAYLHTNASCGLSRKEARSRYRRFGANTLFDAQKGAENRFLKAFFCDPTLLLLIFACLLLLLFSGIGQGIAAVSALVAVLGLSVKLLLSERKLWLELQKSAVPLVTVQRDGRALTVSARTLVVGDILILRRGDTVGADCRLLQAENLRVLTLTNAETPVLCEKKIAARAESFRESEKELLCGGTVILSGTAVAMVTATGEDCFGKRHSDLAMFSESGERGVSPTAGIHPFLRFFGFAVMILLLPAAVFGILLCGEELGIMPIFASLCAAAACASPAWLLFCFRMSGFFARKVGVVGDGSEKKYPCFLSESGMTRLSSLTDVFVFGHAMTSDGLLHLYRCAIGDGEVALRPDAPDASLQALCEAFLLYSAAMKEQDARDVLYTTLRRELTERSGFDAEALAMRLSTAEGRVEPGGDVSLRVQLKTGEFALLFSEHSRVTDTCTFYEKNKKTVVLSAQHKAVLSRFAEDVTEQGARAITVVKQVGTQRIFLGTVALREELQSNVPERLQTLQQNGIRATFFLTGDERDEARYAAALGLSEPVSLAAAEFSANAPALCEHHRVFFGANPATVVALVQHLRRQRRRVAVVSGDVDALFAMRAANLSVACDELRAGRGVSGNLAPCASAVRSRAGVLLPRADRTEGGLAAFARGLSLCRTAEQRMTACFLFFLRSGVFGAALLLLSAFLGVGAFNVLQVLYTGGFVPLICVLWLSVVPISPKKQNAFAPLSRRKILSAFADLGMWLPQLSAAAVTVLYAGILYWCGVLTLSAVSSFLFGACLLMYVISFCRTAWGTNKEYAIKNSRTVLAITVLPAAVAISLSALFSPVGALLGMGTWKLCTVLCLPFVPVLEWIFRLLISSFLRRTAK